MSTLDRKYATSLEHLLFDLPVSLFPFQWECVQFMLEKEYILNSCSMGLGKSLQSIALIIATGLKALIVCPASLKFNWQNEIQKFSRLSCGFATKKADLKDKKWHDLDIMIVNYEQLDSCKQFFESRPLVIVDECQALKNPTTNRTTLMFQYLQIFCPQRLVLLSGTPIKNRIPEMWSYLHMLAMCPTRNNGLKLTETPYKSYYAFCNYFSHAIERQIGSIKVRTYEGVKNLPELEALLADKYIKKTAEEVLDLPDFTRTNIVAETYKKFNALEQELAKEWQSYEKTGKKPISTAKKELAMVKVDTTINLACSILESEEKLIIFSDHIESIDTIALKLKKAGFSALVIKGSTPIKERNATVKEFQEGDLDVICLTIGAGSTGLTLTAANTMIFNDLAWVPTDILQAEKRCLRIGQTKKCFYYTVTYGKIDALIQATLARKLEVIAQV